MAAAVVLLVVVGAGRAGAGPSEDELLDWRHFRDHEHQLFDTANGVFDASFDPVELAQLQSLWKHARRGFLARRTEKIPPRCRETSKASRVLAHHPLLESHVVFLLEPYGGVRQWYEWRRPEEGRRPCMHTQLLRHDPIVIGRDGVYLGRPDREVFDRIMAREARRIDTSEDAERLLDLYLNLTSRIRPIPSARVDDHRKLMASRLVDADRDAARSVLERVGGPTFEVSDDSVTATFFACSDRALVSPLGLTRWTLTFERDGRVRDESFETLLEHEPHGARLRMPT